jgi:hypothetical protein
VFTVRENGPKTGQKNGALISINSNSLPNLCPSKNFLISTKYSSYVCCMIYEKIEQILLPVVREFNPQNTTRHDSDGDALHARKGSLIGSEKENQKVKKGE